MQTSRMHPPIGMLGKLSLDTTLAMPPVTRSQVLPGGPLQRPPPQEMDTETDTDTETETDSDDEGPVRSPMTGLLYSLDQLDDETHELVHELFRPLAPEETPPMVVEWCGISNDPDVYAFQLREVVPRTIRIGAPASRIPRPHCTCAGAGSSTRPCRHLVWLLDQIAKQTLPDHRPDEPLVLDAATGCPQALLGSAAHRRIADFHIDVLATTLHCSSAGGPPVRRQPSAQRVREAREVLAGLAGVRDDAGVDAYAPEIFDAGEDWLQQFLWGDSVSFEDTDDHPPLRGDLQRTVLRLLVSNDEFFAMFLKLLSPHDKAHDPFRKIQQRIEYVLQVLTAERRRRRSAVSVVSAASDAPTSPETVTVAWAAQHVQSAVRQIGLLLRHLQAKQGGQGQGPRQQQPCHPRARESAGRALLWIFHTLVFQHNLDVHPGATQDDRNLYQRLIGNAGGGSSPGTATASTPMPGLFLLDELQLVADQVQFQEQLEHIRQRIQVNGYRQPYMQRLDAILAQMRATVAGKDEAGQGDSGSSSSHSRGRLAAGAKRQGSAATSSERSAKRAREGAAG